MNREVVIHLSPTNRQVSRSRLDYLDPRLMLIVAVILVVGTVRELASGKNILGTVMLFAGAAAVALVYLRLRRANVTLYVRGDRIGTTNSLGSEVGSLVMCAVTLPQRARPLPLLIAVSKAGRCLFRLSGADLLGIAGIRQVAETAGLNLIGSWTDTLSLDQLGANYPGASSRAADFFAWILTHRAAVRAAIILTTVLIFAVVVGVATSRH
jgi:hypothetical protein